jgi:hypothetical protein
MTIFFDFRNKNPIHGGSGLSGWQKSGSTRP